MTTCPDCPRIGGRRRVCCMDRGEIAKRRDDDELALAIAGAPVNLNRAGRRALLAKLRKGKPDA